MPHKWLGPDERPERFRRRAQRTAKKGGQATAPHAEVTARTGMTRYEYLQRLHARMHMLKVRLGEE